MSHLNSDDSNGIKVDSPSLNPEDKWVSIQASEERYAGLATSYSKLQEEHKQKEEELKQKEDRIVQLTAMCYTLARRLRNESFADNITAVTRQQMAEMAMQSLNMTPDVWVLVHKTEEQQQQASS